MPERAALVTALIVERPTCVDCVSLKSGLALAPLEETLALIRGALQIHEEFGRCRACGETKRTVSLIRRP